MTKLTCFFSTSSKQPNFLTVLYRLVQKDKKNSVFFLLNYVKWLSINQMNLPSFTSPWCSVYTCSSYLHAHLLQLSR